MARKRFHTRRSPRSNPRGLISVTASGYGFVETAEGSFFIPASKMGGAFDGDIVEVAPMHIDRKHQGKGEDAKRPTDKPSGRVVRVLHRAHESIIGRYEVADPFGVVVPEDYRIPYDIFTLRSDYPDIEDGSIVRVRMVEYPSRKTAATGVIEEVLGPSGDVANLDIEVLIGRHKLETEFSSGALKQAAEARVNVAGALSEGYRDLRGSFIFTIDPEDARDFDDAVSLRQSKNGLWKLGVHIADVSHYVPWNSSLDLDARRRATSVYLVDRVIPMIPEALSGDICSLVPGKARRCMSVEATIAPDGRVLESQIFPSIIESKARLSYEQAQCIIEQAQRGGDWAAAKQEARALGIPAGALAIEDTAWQQLFCLLPQLHRIASLRKELRHARGGIDFETTEAKVLLDQNAEPLAVKLRSKTCATAAIEEAMLMANECVARRLDSSAIPALFRVHEAPSPDTLSELVPILQEFGYTQSVSVEDFVLGKPHALQAVLEGAQGRPEASLVTQLLLRSMQRAVYSPHCEQHYALASQAYCHFTSPIRRYPDLVVHRMLKALLFGKSESYGSEVDSLPWLAEHASEMERIADAAARESQELKLVEYMRRFVGMDFTGLISGVTNFGLYVQLENTAEGLLPVRALGQEYFFFDPALYTLTGSDTATVFRLGQRIRVNLVAAPPHQRTLEFRLAQ